MLSETNYFVCLPTGCVSENSPVFILLLPILQLQNSSHVRFDIHCDHFYKSLSSLDLFPFVFSEQEVCPNPLCGHDASLHFRWWKRVRVVDILSLSKKKNNALKLSLCIS